MLNKVIIIPLLFGLLLFGSCKSGYSPEVQKLYDEVMVIHDEVMPEMGTIHKLKKQFKSALKNSDVQDNKKSIEDQINALDFADDAMMEWMHQFKVPKDVSEKVQLEYLNDQKSKMTKVNLDMKNIINTARNEIKKYK